MPIGTTTLHLTVSIGVTEAGPDAAAASILHRADAALYAAKAGGRDQVVEDGFAPPDLLRRTSRPSS